MTAASDETPRLLPAAGPLAAEQQLLLQLQARAAEPRADPALLAVPVRVVVPSARLREHVLARIADVLGATAGVRVQTLNGLALELLAGADAPVRRGDSLFPVLVRRCARAEPALRAALDALDDGYGAAGAAVADLLDAGFLPDVPAHAEAVEEAVAEADMAPGTRERVLGVVRTAVATGRALRDAGVAREGGRLRLAADLLGSAPELLPARAVYVHGFADATGAASELLEALLRHAGARLIVDLAPDPADPERPDFGVAFTDRLVERLGAVGAQPVAPAPARPRLRAVRAVGTEAEVRAVAERILTLLDAGARPERIGVVARDAAGYATAIRTHFGRLGIGFAAPATAGPPSGRGRALFGLLALLREGDATPADRWLDLRRSPGRGERADLRLGLHAAGVGRLRDVAELDAASLLDAEDTLELPARLGLADARAGGGRRRLAGATLREALEAAAAAKRALAEWPAPLPFAEHAGRLVDFARDGLAWHDDEPLESLADALEPLAAELGGEPLAFDEFVMVLRAALRERAAEEFGSRGAGVRVLGVDAARSQTFDHLFVLGLNRDAFPRPLLDDPLLPDAVRRPLEPLLPEIPLKSRTFEEEHYLFAQLLAASPEVTLSWQVADDDGRARSESPFVARLRGAGALPEADAAVGAHAVAYRPSAPRTAAEAAVLAGLHGTSAHFAALLPLALAETQGGDRADAGARGRLAVLSGLDLPPHLDSLGPYDGFVGPVQTDADPRRRPVYVTHLERMLGCSWRYFVERMLRLEPAPDALAALPAASPLLVGDVVHRVLERIVAEVLPDGAAAEPIAVPWPDAAGLDGLLVTCAREVAAASGIGVAGFERLLAAVARPGVLAAREHAWPEPDSGVVCRGAELPGEVEVGLPPRVVRYRVDRVDEVGGVPRLVDYKTGRPASQRQLAADVARGRRLQAAAYAFGAGGEGRYVYLSADAPAKAVVAAEASDESLRESFVETVELALLALDAGAFVPRLTDKPNGEKAPHCAACDVREACVQGDSGVRARLARWSQKARGDSAAEAQALALWRRGAGGGR